MLPISKETKAIPERPKSQAQIDIVFKATLPALGVMTFLLQKKENQSFKSEGIHFENTVFDCFINSKTRVEL